jgi:hypothetical protein
MHRFSYRETKDGRVRVALHGRHVITLAGDDAQRQLLLAKATGNFKRGNERR